MSRSFRVSVGGENQLSLSYEYDGFSRLSAVNQKESGDSSKQIAAYSYNQDGSLSASEVHDLGLTTHYSYDYAGDLTELSNNDSSGGLLSKYTCTYRLNGQKTAEKEERETKEAKEAKRKVRNTEYTYDRLGRLRTESHTGEETITYAYDSHGNRNEMTQGNRVTAYQYDRNGNELAVVHRQKTGSNSPVFDLNVTVGRNQLNPNAVYHYDAENQLAAALVGKNKVLYTYDADGNRLSKTVNGKTTYYIWDGDQIVLELNEKGEVKKRYLRGDSLICSDSGEGTESTYYVNNSHGDVVQLLNQEGAVTHEYDYDAFGNEINPDKKDDNPFRYAGEYYDKETESIYLRARSYMPALGRFMTRDTYTGEADDPLSLHLYVYCDNDGVNQVDPSGHWGRTNGKYVHQEITGEAFDQYIKESKYTSDYFLKTLGIKNYDVMIDGSILPDLLNSKDKKIFGASGSERQRIKGIRKRIEKMKKSRKNRMENDVLKLLRANIQSRYYKKYFQKYKRRNWEILDINISNNNMLHGKSKVKLKKLKDKSTNVIKSASQAEKKKYPQKVQEYHKDWKKTKRNKKVHGETKDNPNAIFAYNTRKEGWEWRPRFHSAEVNPRYEKAINDSKKYLKDAVPID